MQKTVDKKETDVLLAGADVVRREKYFAQKTASVSDVRPERTFLRLKA